VRIAAALLAAIPCIASEECQACHPAQFQKHAATKHSRSLTPVIETDFFRQLPAGPIGEARGGFYLSYERDGNTLRVTAQRGAERAAGVIEWTFGAGVQALTPLVRVGERYFEHRLSYYARPKRYGLTLGHEPGVSATAETALGVEQAPRKVAACFGCHASARGPEVVSAGVGCLHCHAGSEDHARSKGAIAARNPRHLSARAEVALCATCHRSSPPVSEGDPLNVRFQPLRMVKSRCYIRGNLRCGSCHGAHQDLQRDAGHYRRACLSCHPTQSAKGNCVECHMPASSPAPYLSFTDHFIRKTP